MVWNITGHGWDNWLLQCVTDACTVVTGIALMPDQWEKLKNNMDEIDEVLDNL